MDQNSIWVLLLGALAQLLFSSRLIVQWILTEKQRRVVTPALFWELSLLASILLFYYGYLRDDFSIMLGQVLTYYIYIRNMDLQGHWKKIYFPLRIIICCIPALFIVFGYNNGIYDRAKLFDHEHIARPLLILGIVSQMLFTLRFVVQWLVSESKRRSVLPYAFWGISLIGSMAILLYAVLRKDPVLFFGHIFGAFVYSRNLYIIRRQA
ncbi:lipid-A-disaccharide synthase N-terminal domain-containing protein [Sphingobacterium paludis]|uniref:Lipid A biosynthesis-like protein n=1 Tax=Sphingobacterium paludis TaxID=1476465 RepID=A0A4R7CXE9_9SPHI|nr:lipid-A-disaccharide synthase N-terminal domain-containing protein [Sphingobacterium paludis]TDS12960.1 lipid A biosynthesis-like protein [Sphingobacterium paludis]